MSWFTYAVAFNFATVGFLTSTICWCSEEKTATDPVLQSRVVIFAVRDIQKGRQLTSCDIQEAIINTKGFDQKSIPCWSSVIRQYPKYSFKKGQILFKSDIEVSSANRVEVSSMCPMTRNKFVRARNVIEAGAIIKRSDLMAGNIPFCSSARWSQDLNEIVGRRTRASIEEGQIITFDVLVEPRKSSSAFGKTH